jgi:hypothetical protein
LWWWWCGGGTKEGGSLHKYSHRKGDPSSSSKKLSCTESKGEREGGLMPHTRACLVDEGEDAVLGHAAVLLEEGRKETCVE